MADDPETVWVYNKACGTHMKINAADFRADLHQYEPPANAKSKAGGEVVKIETADGKGLETDEKEKKAKNGDKKKDNGGDDKKVQRETL